MFRSLLPAVMLVFAAPAAAKLEIKDIIPAYGRLGPPRPDLQVLPYDQVFFRYLLTGLKTTADGDAEVMTTVTVAGPGGKTTGGEPLTAKIPLVFGGNQLPSFATVFLTPEQKPGKYEMKVKVKDVLSGEEAEFSRELELLPMKFAITSLNFTHDPAGEIPSPAGGPAGHAVFVRFLIVGFEKVKNKIEVDVEARVLDMAGEPIRPKAMTSTLKSDKADEVKQAKTLTVVNSLLLHAPGAYQLEIILTDKLAGKLTGVRVPISIQPTENPKTMKSER